ncbi:hypothetical protein [[Clostridium] polysaccharolyticum]|uniref:Uncharacterized protein n=1 Tax=[Clostridium] polysaccharolyticum TaxID=29364 RepID=A0A1I0EHQ3_9FIRM|nr:hypothetical protein [[Clostridium] polysaccharolyticum]SET44713.1 hypothetical protein SAMN04487772_12131 [[Clostridium] polysaccharolyticum]
MRKKEREPDYRSFVNKKKIPIITLDPKWHELFPDDAKTAVIRQLEKKLNDLLKQQGKLVNEIKDMKKLKMQLMNQIVASMGEGATEEAERKRGKKTEVSQKMILEINDKLEVRNDELLDIPYKIREANELLVVECLKYWYSLIQENTADIKKLDSWIMSVREELKSRLLEKQEKEEINQKVYSYMHNLLGHDVINKFDHSFVDKGSDIE